MPWRSERQRRGRIWRTRPICERPASLTSQGCPRRPVQPAQASGSKPTSREREDTDPLRGVGFARSLARHGRSWQDDSTSCSQATRPPPPTYSGLARPPVTGAGGVVRASDRHATTFSSGADGGPPKSEGCGRELRGTVSGSPPGPPPSASSSETRALRRQYLSF